MNPEQAQGLLPLLVSVVPFFLIFMVMYFLIIRPQQKKQKLLAQKIKDLKKGDQVITSGGLCGQIVGLKEQRAVIKVADNVKIEVVKDSIVSVNNDNWSVASR